MWRAIWNAIFFEEASFHLLSINGAVCDVLRVEYSSHIIALLCHYNNLSPISPYATQGGASCSHSSNDLQHDSSGDSFAPSADQDTTHLFIRREGLQRNGHVPSPRACECGLSHRNLDLRRSAFRQNTGCEKKHMCVGVMDSKSKPDEPRVSLGDSAGRPLQRGVQL